MYRTVIISGLYNLISTSSLSIEFDYDLIDISDEYISLIDWLT